MKMNEKDPFARYREAQNLDVRQRRAKEQVMLAELDRLSREYLVEDSLGEKPIGVSQDSYEFVSEFFDKYNQPIIKELYGEDRYKQIAGKKIIADDLANENGEIEGEFKNFIEDAKDFLMVALEKIRAEAEVGKLTLPSVKTITKKIEKRKSAEMQKQAPIRPERREPPREWLKEHERKQDDAPVIKILKKDEDK